MAVLVTLECELNIKHFFRRVPQLAVFFLKCTTNREVIMHNSLCIILHTFKVLHMGLKNTQSERVSFSSLIQQVGGGAYTTYQFTLGRDIM